MDYFPVTYFYLTSLCPALDTEKGFHFLHTAASRCGNLQEVMRYQVPFWVNSWLSSISRGRQLLCLAEVVSQQGGATAGLIRWHKADCRLFSFIKSNVWCCFSLAFKDTGNQFFTAGWAAFMPKTNSCNETLQLLFSRCPGGVGVGGLHVINMTGHMQLQLPLHMVGCILMDSLVFTRQCQRGV